MDARSARYLAKFDEVNLMAGLSWSHITWETTERKIRQLEDDFLDFLIEAYLMGCQDAGEMLGFYEETGSDRMHEVIYRHIAGETFVDRIRKHVDNDDLPALRVLAESEFHRVYNAALVDEAQLFADETGSLVIKKWHTMQDPNVRETHDFIGGVEKPLDEEFYTFDGDHAMEPGDFILPENNVNCRCWLTFSIGEFGGREVALQNSQTQTSE